MTDAQILALIQTAYPGLTSAIRATIGDTAIAAQISIGLAQQVSTKIGEGDVLNALGPVAGASLLGAMQTSATSNTTPEYWGLRLLAAGTLDVSLPSTRGQFSALVAAGAMTAAQESALIALCTVPMIISQPDVSRILNDGGY